MSKNIEELIKENLNEKGKLDCKSAFKISAKTKTAVLEVGNIAKQMNIRIDSCDLGQFGKLDKSKYSQIALDKITPLLDEEKRVFCKDARAAAAGVGLPTIRGTLAKNFIDVKYCELGCFTEKKGKKLKIKLDTFIIDGRGESVIDDDFFDVLQFLVEEKSITKASEQFGMKSDDILENIVVMQRKFCKIFVEDLSDLENIVLTDELKDVLAKYKSINDELNKLANSRFKELFLPPRKV